MPQPPEDKDQKAALGLLQTLEQFDVIASTLRGMAAKLEREGFTPEQARQIVTDVFHLGTAQAANKEKDEDQ